MIEFFKEPNIDWMGKAKYFYGLSGILLLAGLISWVHQGGLRYGIDFKGGTNVDVRFAQPPNVDQVRDALKTQGLGNSEIQAISSGGLTASNSNEVLIFVEQKGQGDQALDTSKAPSSDRAERNIRSQGFQQAGLQRRDAFFTGRGAHLE